MVGGPGEADPLLLAAAEVNSVLPDLGLVAAGEDLQVGVEGAGLRGKNNFYMLYNLSII